MKKTGKYHELAQCICINITNFDFTKEDEGHSIHVVKNDKTNKRVMHDFEIHFVELAKREKVGDIRLQKWMALFSSKSWEEMRKISEGDDIMSQVYNQAREIAMNETKRIEVENRERWIIDQNSIMHHAHEEGRLEGKLEGRLEGRLEGKLEMAAKMLLKNKPVDEIIEFTELTEEKINEIRKTLP